MKIKIDLIKLNNKGTILPFSFMLVILILAFFFIYISQDLLQLKKLKFRNNSYLCTKYLNIETQGFIKTIIQTNRLIKVNHYLQFAPIPAVSKAAQSTLKGLKIYQQLIFISYVKNTTSNSYCGMNYSKIFGINPPVETIATLALMRTNTEEAIIKKRWKMMIPFIAPAPLDKYKDSLIMGLKLNQTHTEIVTWENSYDAKKASWKSNLSVGALSSPSY